MAFIVQFHKVGEPDNVIKFSFETLEEAQHFAKLTDDHLDWVYKHIGHEIELLKRNNHKQEKLDLKSMTLVSQGLVSNYYGEIDLYRFHDEYFLTLGNYDCDSGRQVSKEFAEAFQKEFGNCEE